MGFQPMRAIQGFEEFPVAEGHSTHCLARTGWKPVPQGGKMKRDLLAWCQFPEPQGTPYGEQDLADPAKVAELLDRAQVHRAWIAREGWEALWRLYGLEGLLDLNQR